MTGACSATTHRHRLRDARTTATATSSAHPMCSDGIAAYWFAISSAAAGYADGPTVSIVSTAPIPASLGGASGKSMCTTSPAAVSTTSSFRTRR
nr:hypothetical protein [Actinomadura graeca]